MKEVTICVVLDQLQFKKVDPPLLYETVVALINGAPLAVPHFDHCKYDCYLLSDAFLQGIPVNDVVISMLHELKFEVSLLDRQKAFGVAVFMRKGKGSLNRRDVTLFKQLWHKYSPNKAS